MSKLVSRILGQNFAITTISPFSNNQIIFGTDAEELNIYDLGGKKISWTEETIGTPVAAFPFSNNEKIFSQEDRGFLVVRDLYDREFERIIGFHRRSSFAKIFSNGEKIITAGSDKKIKMWNLGLKGYLLDSNQQNPTKIMEEIQSIPCFKTFEGHNNAVNDLAIFSNQTKIISGSADGILKVWNLETNGCITFGDTSDSIMSLSLFSDNSKVVTGLRNGDLKIWNLENRELLSELKGHKGDITKVTIIPNEKIISASSDRTLRIWDPITEECLSVLEGHTDRIRTFAVLPGDKQIVSGSGNGEIFLWDI